MALNVDDISELYALHARAVIAFFARRVLDPELAVELMAETFAEAMTSRGSFRGEDSDAAAAWLFGIARHQLSGWRRKASVRRRALSRLGLEPPHLSDLELERIDELAASADLRAAVAAQLDELGPDHRRAVHLRVVDERSYDEVAAELGISEQAARARVSRGLRTLGRVLREEGYAV